MDKFFRYLLQNQIILALIIVAAVWFLLQIQTTIVVFFLAYTLMAGFLPLVQFFQKKGFPKLIAIAFIYIPIVILVFLSGYMLGPQLVSQTRDFVNNLPDLLVKLGTALRIRNIQSLTSLANISSANIFSLTFTAAQFIIAVIAIFAISIYMLVGRERMNGFFASLIPRFTREEVMNALETVELGLGRWLRGQIILSAAVGFMVWIFLLVLGIPGAAPLGLLSGIFEIVPYVGPILSAVPGILLALNISLTEALVVAIGYFVIHQLESNLLVPNIMGESVDLPPLAVLIVVLAGAEVGGVIGALVAVPLATFVNAIIQYLNRENGRRKASRAAP